MAYQNYTDDGTVNRTRRRRTTASSQTTTRRKRRKKKNQIRFDLIFLAAIALVVILVIAMPRQQVQDPVPSDDGTTMRTPEPNQTTAPEPTEPPVSAYAQDPLTFTAEDSELIYVRTICSGKAGEEDVQKALTAPLDWNLTDPNFTVLIIHSHVSESYTKTEGQEYSYKGGDPYRTDDERYNMVAVGQRVAEVLRQHGIHVIHDTTSFEIPNSDYSYSNAREHLDQLLAENPNIGLILDLHRDAVSNEDGTQWAPTVTVNGEEAAKISMLIGFNGEYDSTWDQNLAFAVKLGAQMNHNVSRQFRQLLINSSNTCFNQDMGPVTMLIEVGTAGNSLEEAVIAAECLGQAVADMASGANIE